MRDDIIINTTKEEEAFIKRLITMNFKYHVKQSVIDIVSLCGEKVIKLEKSKNPEKEEWEIPAVIPLMPIVRVNNCLPI